MVGKRAGGGSGRDELVEELSASEHRLIRLQAATEALSASATARGVAEVSVEQGITALQGARAAVHVLDEDGGLELAASTGYGETALHALRPAADAIRRGELVALETPGEIAERYPSHARAVGRSGDRASLHVPLASGGGMLGCLSVGFDAPRRFTAEERGLVLTLARQCGQALERARLFEREREARRRALLATRRLRRLQSATAALARALSARDVAEVAVREVAEAFAAEDAAVHLVDPASGDLRPAARYTGEILEAAETAPAARRALVGPVLAGETTWFPSRAALAERHPALGAAAEGYEAFGLAPLVGKSESLGLLVLAFAEERELAAEERELFETFARQIGQALERAELFRQEHAYREGVERILDVAPVLQLSGTPAEVAKEICRTAVQAFAVDVAHIFDVGEGEFVVVCREPGSGLIPPGTRLPIDDFPGLEAALGERRPMFVSDAQASVREEALMQARSAGLRSSLRIPIGVGAGADRLLVLSWLQVVDAPAGAALAVLRRFADQAALALAQAERRASELLAARSVERVAALQRITAALSAAVTVEDVARVLVEQARTALAAVSGAVAVAPLGRGELELLHEAGAAGSAGASVAPGQPLAEAILRERHVLGRAEIAVPLLVGGRALGALRLRFAEGRQISEDELVFLESLARQAAQALERAQLYAREYAIADALQQSVVPDELPAIEGLDVAARYLPGSEGVDVGGDWYDLFPLPDGRVGLAIGDVVGKGVTAASIMAQLRNALRAYALEGFEPAEVLERLNRLAQISGAQLATVFFAAVDPETGRCRYSAGGHPPPLLLPAGGRPEFVEGASSLPLGIFAETEYGHGEIELEPGSTLVLYTDGLVERRGSTLDAGLARLSAAAENPPADADALLDQLLERALGEREDDVAVIAVRLVGARSPSLDVRAPSRIEALGSLREELVRWLERTGVPAGAAEDICLASWEACTNAIEHAQAPTDPVVELRAEDERGEILVSVRDFGRWRAPTSRADRGLGLRLMEGLMDSLEIVRSERGTTVQMRRRIHADAAA